MTCLLLTLALMCENVNAAPEVHDVVPVSSSRCSCVAFGGSALQSAEDRLSAIRAAWSLHRSLDGLPQGVMGEFVSIRSVCETRMGRSLGEQPIQNGGRRTRLGLDFGGHWDYSLHLATATARDSQFRRSGSRKTCDSSRQSDLRLLLLEGGVHPRRIHEGRLMGVADAAERNATGNTSPALILSHPLCQTGFWIKQRVDDRDRNGIIIKSRWVFGCAKGRIVYGRKV